MTILKRCRECQIDWPLENYRKNSKNKDGLKTKCKTCDSEEMALRYANCNKEKFIAKVRRWQSRNRKKMQVYRKTEAIKRENKRLANTTSPENGKVGGVL